MLQPTGVPLGHFPPSPAARRPSRSSEVVTGSRRRSRSGAASPVAPRGHRRRQPQRARRPRTAWIGLPASAAAVVATAFLVPYVGNGQKQLPDDPASNGSDARSELPRARPSPPKDHVESRGSRSARPPARRSTDTDKPVSVPEAASGRFQIAPTPSAPRKSTPTTMTYQVEVEEGLSFAPAGFARAVDATLSDPRGWASPGHEFTRVANDASVRIILASPQTADDLCAPLDTGGRLSCRNGDRVVINAWRWVNGAPSYGKDIGAYRRYLINHEFGHALGLPHAACPGNGAPAPVMLQQTKTLDGCRANAWPGGVDRP